MSKDVLEQLNLKSVKSSDFVEKLRAKFESVAREKAPSAATQLMNGGKTSGGSLSGTSFNTKHLQTENRILKERITELKKELERAIETKKETSRNLDFFFF